MQFKLLDDQRCMTRAVDARIAAIVIFVLFTRGTRTLVGRREVRTFLIARRHMILHGMSTFAHAVDRDGQYDHEKQQGKKFKGD